MRANIQKLGNSLTLRIPEPVATQVGIEKDTPVDIAIENGKIIITPVKRHRRTLAEMVALITDENRHEEIDFGPPVGREVW